MLVRYLCWLQSHISLSVHSFESMVVELALGVRFEHRVLVSRNLMGAMSLAVAIRPLVGRSLIQI